MQIRGKLQHQFLAAILILALTMTVMTGCSKKKESASEPAKQESLESVQPEVTALPLDTVLLTVDGKEYTISDMMYVIYSQEEYYNNLAIQYTEEDNVDFWNDILDENTNETGREMALEDTISAMKRLILLRQVVEESNYKLNSDDQEEIDAYVQNVLENMDDEHGKRTGFTKDNLAQKITDYLLVDAYTREQADKEKVNEEKIKESMNYDDYKQREVESVFIQTVSEDADGNQVEKPIEEVSELVKKANQILAKVNAGEAMEQAYQSVATQDDEDITYMDLPLSDEDMAEEVLKAVDTLKDGQSYEKLIETEGGYYIVKLVNSKSTNLYDDEVQYQIEVEKQKVYKEKLEQMYAEHSIVENEEAFGKLVLGNYAYTLREEAEIDDSEFFEESDSNSQDTIILPDDAADGDDGSVG